MSIVIRHPSPDLMPKTWPEPKRQPCNCDRIGCAGDHSEHYRRKAALRRLIDRETHHD